jgi:mannose-1-phosphate guanylyltransferase
MSRDERPKQFLSLAGETTLFQQTVLRVKKLHGIAAPIVVCNEGHRFLAAEQLRAIGIQAQTIVLEPAGRNTAPAAAIAALLARRTAGGAEPLLLVLPADHVIRNEDAFKSAVEAAAASAVAGHLVTFGVIPDRPETGYGYLLRGRDTGHGSVLERFEEKPDLTTATECCGGRSIRPRLHASWHEVPRVSFKLN